MRSAWTDQMRWSAWTHNSRIFAGLSLGSCRDPEGSAAALKPFIVVGLSVVVLSGFRSVCGRIVCVTLSLFLSPSLFSLSLISRARASCLSVCVCLLCSPSVFSRSVSVPLSSRLSLPAVAFHAHYAHDKEDATVPGKCIRHSENVKLLQLSDMACLGPHIYVLT